MSKDLYVWLWSGGKDSSWGVYQSLKMGKRVDYVITYDTPELPEMYVYKERFAKAIKDKFGIETLTIPTIKDDIFDRWALGKYKSGRYKGRVRGWPFFHGVSYCTRELKVNPYKKYIAENFKGYEIKKYIGIASDEKKRLDRDKDAIYFLRDHEQTEADCLAGLKSVKLHNPIYDHHRRTGCWFCPKQDEHGFRIMRNHWPEKWKQLLEIDKRIYMSDAHIINIIPGFTVAQLERKFEIEDNEKTKKKNQTDCGQLELF